MHEHCGPFQPRPFCDSVILEEGNTAQLCGRSLCSVPSWTSLLGRARKIPFIFFREL